MMSAPGVVAIIAAMNVATADSSRQDFQRCDAGRLGFPTYVTARRLNPFGVLDGDSMRRRERQGSGPDARAVAVATPPARGRPRVWLMRDGSCWADLNRNGRMDTHFLRLTNGDIFVDSRGRGRFDAGPF